uniref:Addiction module component n=1 Tax=Candidatus Kentrum sp. DK TaxID=2126562 RepID=A0A450SMS1_9GAMM|nr:MAG: Putative addiction module component [Candidatus Kentron sp. DK]
MNFQEIQNEALHLSERNRAELVRNLLISLDEPAEPNRVSMDWLLEAQRRAGEPDSGIVRPVPSEEVARKAQPMDVAFLRSLEGTLNEWTSEADEEAWRDL